MSERSIMLSRGEKSVAGHGFDANRSFGKTHPLP